MKEDLIKLKEEELKYVEEKITSFLNEYEEKNKDIKVIDKYVLGQIIVLILCITQFFISPSVIVKVLSAIEVLGFSPFIYKGVKYISEEKKEINKLSANINKFISNKELLIEDLKTLINSNTKDITKDDTYDNTNIKENSIQNTKNKARTRKR